MRVSRILQEQTLHFRVFSPLKLSILQKLTLCKALMYKAFSTVQWGYNFFVRF